MKKTSDNDFLKKMQKGVESVLDSEAATPAEKLAAITAGTRILQTKHKIKDEGDAGGKFFANR